MEEIKYKFDQIEKHSNNYTYLYSIFTYIIWLWNWTIQLLIWFWIFLLMWDFENIIADNKYLNSYCVYTSVTFMVYILNGFCSHTFSTLCEVPKFKTLTQYKDTLFLSNPKIMFKIENYHEGKNKNKVITGIESEEFKYLSARDITDMTYINIIISELITNTDKHYVKFFINLELHSADIKTKLDYESQKTEFINRYKANDINNNFTSVSNLDFNNLNTENDFNNFNLAICFSRVSY